MHIPLPIHLSIHFILAVLAGFLVGRHYNKVKLGIIAGVIGGFFIDVDHILEYFFAFGPHFNVTYFIQGRQFLLSNRMILIFHAWEYAPILLLAAWLVRRRQSLSVFILTLTFGAMVHLVTDCVLNNYPPRNYSILYRASQGFSASRLLNPDQLEFNAELKQDLGL